MYQGIRIAARKNAIMVFSDTGEYVFHSDYAKLEEELETYKSLFNHMLIQSIKNSKE